MRVVVLFVWCGLAGRGDVVLWGRACTGLPEESELQGAFDAPVGCALEELTWLEDATASALGRLRVQVGGLERKAVLRFPAGLPGCVCLYGPPGCGKTSLALALAQRLRSHSQYLVRRGPTLSRRFFVLLAPHRRLGVESVCSLASLLSLC